MKISIPLMPDGKCSREVEAEMVGTYLAVHQWPGPPESLEAPQGKPYWVVTHVPTGFRVAMGERGRWKTRAAALAFAADITDADWNHGTPESVMAAVQEVVFAAMRKRGVKI